MKTITLSFDGYWCEINRDGIPAQSGVYCVYSCEVNSDRVISIHDLLYIGEGGDVNDRIKNHNRKNDWMRSLTPGETICYSFAAIDAIDRERAEAALIFKIQPPFNDEHTKVFAYDDTEMVVEGKNALLEQRFNVVKDERHGITYL